MKNKYWIKGGIIGVIILFGLPSIFIYTTIVYLYVKAGKTEELSVLFNTIFSGFSDFPGWYGIAPIAASFGVGALWSIFWRKSQQELIANKAWFRKPKLADAIWSKGFVIPYSIEGWIWSYFVAGTAFFFVLNFGASVTGIVGSILTVLVGQAVAIYKSK